MGLGKGEGRGDDGEIGNIVLLVEFGMWSGIWQKVVIDVCMVHAFDVSFHLISKIL